MKLVTKWNHDLVRVVDGVRWKLVGGILYRDTADEHAWFVQPPSVCTPRERRQWADRVIMAEACKRLKHAQRVLRELEKTR